MLDEIKLETPVTSTKEQEADLQAPPVKDKSKRGLFLTNAVAKWSEESHDPILNNISVHLIPGKLVAIIGPVGSGKVNILTCLTLALSLALALIFNQRVSAFIAQNALILRVFTSLLWN